MVHFVDDFAAVEPNDTTESSFRACHDLWSSLGFQFKEPKKQPPATEHKLQGIVMSTHKDKFALSPDKERLKRVCSRIQEILLDDQLDDEEAMRLAGKLQFIAETLSGQALRSCLMPLYQRGYQQPGKIKLSDSLRDALLTIQYLLTVMKPKIVHFKMTQPAVIYANAFFTAGDKKIKLSDAATAEFNADITNLYKNGWGFVAKLPDGQVVYAAGEIPPKLVGLFTTKRAFIYSLEIIAQIIALVVLRPWLPEVAWCWCDNTASETALGKGYGRDRKVNRLLACLWTYVCMAQIDPHWRRVVSSANISDPISRQDFSLADEHKWSKIEGLWDEIYHTLVNATKSLEQAQKWLIVYWLCAAILIGAILWRGQVAPLWLESACLKHQSSQCDRPQRHIQKGADDRAHCEWGGIPECFGVQSICTEEHVREQPHARAVVAQIPFFSPQPPTQVRA